MEWVKKKFFTELEKVFKIKKWKVQLLHITLQQRIDAFKGLRDRICLPSIRTLYTKQWIIIVDRPVTDTSQLLKWKAGKTQCLRSGKGCLFPEIFSTTAMTNFVSKSDYFYAY